MGIRFNKVISDKSERSIDRKLGGRKSVNSKILRIQPLPREIHLRSSRRTRRVKVRTALSCRCPAGETDNGQLFFYYPDRIRTAERHPTQFS